jgi:hypothetical protein
MSSSSSIAAARRRRAGGAGGPTPQSKPTQQQSAPTPTPSNAPINPFTILQQHHVKINKLEQIIQELVTKETGRDMTSSHTTKESASSITSASSAQPDININELSDLIMSRVESQLDLKAFYENDERLMNEIEGLKGIIQSQQIVINGFNNTLYTMLDKLHISVPDSVEIDQQSVSSANEEVSIDAFPKSVVIDEASNTIKEFIASSMKDDDKIDLTCDGLLQA